MGVLKSVRHYTDRTARYFASVTLGNELAHLVTVFDVLDDSDFPDSFTLVAWFTAKGYKKLQISRARFTNIETAFNAITIDREPIKITEVGT